MYRARDTRLDRVVAVKVLSSHLSADPQLRQRFEREARAISSLNHPNICALYDVGEAATPEPIPFLVMELVEGESLSERLTRGPLSLDEALQRGIEIADALSSAHRRGIIHRDIKPGNVMLTKAGAKLLDFGLAKSGPPASVLQGGTAVTTATPPDLTAHGTILGTVQYMAPEQLEGLDLDARTDIFAFGALFFEMITGRKAFAARTQASLIGAILRDQPPVISSVIAVTPPALDRVITKCLAKDPDHRWQDAGDLRDELKWIAEGGSHVGGPTPAAASRRRSGWLGRSSRPPSVVSPHSRHRTCGPRHHRRLSGSRSRRRKAWRLLHAVHPSHRFPPCHRTAPNSCSSLSATAKRLPVSGCRVSTRSTHGGSMTRP